MSEAPPTPPWRSRLSRRGTPRHPAEVVIYQCCAMCAAANRVTPVITLPSGVAICPICDRLP